MTTNPRILFLRYGTAVVTVVLATWLRLLVHPSLGERVPLVMFFPAVVITAWYGGFGPTLLAVVLSWLAAARFFVPPVDAILPTDAPGWVGLALFAVFGVLTAFLSEWMRRNSEQVRQERERFYVTLASIGDGVIVTDEEGRVTFLNSVAEELTGWTLADANGQPLEMVFRIINEQSRQTTENPVAEVLKKGTVVGLANHTVLIAKDGSERAIDDSAAPIRDPLGRIVGVVLVFRDVSQQRQLQIDQGRLAALVDSSQDAIIGQTFEGVVTDWNAGAERLFGYTAEETVGQSIFSKIVPPDRKEELLGVLRRVQHGEHVEQFETMRRCRDLRDIPVAVRISPIRNADGEIVGASAIDRDITRQRQVERRRNARLAVTQILAREQDVEMAITEILSVVCAALGWDAGCFWRYKPDEGVLRCEEFWQEPSRNLQAFRAAAMTLAIEPGRSLPGRVWKNRRPVWIPDVVTDPGFVRAQEAEKVDLHGGFACPVAVGEDFLGVIEWFSHEIRQPDDDLLEMMATIGGQIGQFLERKISEKAVQESERLYRAIGESIEYGVWVCDPEGRNIYTSDSLLRLVGLTQEQSAEFGWGNVLHPDDAEETIAAWKECVRSGRTWYREHRFLGVDGKYHPVLARGVPVWDEEGKVVYWAGINLDISRLKEVEAALRDADRRKDEFLAMLAHELRNPLAPIRSGLDILAMDAGNHRETVMLMQEQVEHVVRLVDDLLDVSRIMRGKVELRVQPVELAGLIKRSVQAVEPLIKSNQQELVVSVPEEPIWLKADPVRLVQAFENLLNNASKYTDAGGRIELTAEREDGEAVICVRDTGVGIDPELLPRVFELFTQSRRSLDRSQGGLGIGLTLVQRLVEIHSGSVEAFSEGVGEGSTFVVRLPAIKAPATSEPTIEEREMAQPRRILVVDDSEAAARMLTMLLTRLDDHEVEAVHDGCTAVEKIKELHPDVVFLDIGLPGMDGYEVAQAVRQMPEFDDVLLVALTGYGQEEDRRKSKEAGFDEHLVKPPSVEQIRAVLSRSKADTSTRDGALT